MTIHAVVEQQINDAATKAAFFRNRLARCENVPHMYNAQRYYAIVIQYDDTQITGLRRAVDVMMSLLPGMSLLTGFVAAKSYYVVVIDTTPEIARQSGGVSTVPPRNGNHANGNGHVKKATKVEYNDLPRAMKSFEKWLESVGRQYLTHSDDAVVDYELDSQGEDTNEVIVYMRSDEHHFVSRYIIGFDKNMDVIDITNATQDDCKACMQESRDAWPEPPQ
jgi:hypothetical protein